MLRYEFAALLMMTSLSLAKNSRIAIKYLGVNVDGLEAYSEVKYIIPNLKRRHLDTAQRAMVASRLANMKHGGDRKSEDFNIEISVLISQQQAAAMLLKINVEDETI